MALTEELDQNHQDILLESGTNEAEFMEFYIGTQSFGVNVAKIKEVLLFDPNQLTVMPESTGSRLGVYSVRDQMISMIDLSVELGKKPKGENERKIVLITEFNSVNYAFLVDGVHRIHRLSWDQLVPLSQYLSKHNARVTASVSVNGNEILILDLEYLTTIMYSNDLLNKDEPVPQALPAAERKREDIRIVFAEDSGLIRNAVVKVLREAGYVQVTECTDGKRAFDEIQRLLQEHKTDSTKPFFDLLITDIEMPQMDGLTLCKKVKQELKLSQLPVIMFSSLINQQMILKCQEVGADGYITKPQVKDLVLLLDKTLLKK